MTTSPSSIGTAHWRRPRGSFYAVRSLRAHIPFKASIEGLSRDFATGLTLSQVRRRPLRAVLDLRPPSSSSTTSKLAVTARPATRFDSRSWANPWRQRQRPRQREANRLPPATRSSPGNITADDAFVAQCTIPAGDESDYLPLSRLGLRSQRATIDGSRSRQTLRNGAREDSLVRLDDAGTQFGDNKANVGSSWPGMSTPTSYGGSDRLVNWAHLGTR